MKQFILLIAMIGLGLVLAGFVLGFSSEAEGLAEDAETAISYTEITSP